MNSASEPMSTSIFLKPFLALGQAGRNHRKGLVNIKAMSGCLLSPRLAKVAAWLWTWHTWLLAGWTEVGPAGQRHWMWQQAHCWLLKREVWFRILPERAATWKAEICLLPRCLCGKT